MLVYMVADACYTPITGITYCHRRHCLLLWKISERVLEGIIIITPRFCKVEMANTSKWLHGYSCNRLCLQSKAHLSHGELTKEFHLLQNAGQPKIIIFRYFRKMGAECNPIARRFFVPLQLD